MTTNDTSINGGGGGGGVAVGDVDEKDGSIYCTFQSGDDGDKSFSQKRRSAVHKLRLDDGKKSVYWLDGSVSTSSSPSSGAAVAADYYKTVAPAHIYIHKQQRPLESSQASSPPVDAYDNIFMLGGFQLVSNAKAIEVYITKAKMSSTTGKYKVSSKEEYLTTIRGYLVKDAAAAAPSTSASSATEPSTGNDDNNGNSSNKNSSDCLYKVLCVVPGGPRPVYCVHLKLLSLQQQQPTSNNGTTMTTTATTEQSRIARVYWMKLTARLPPPQESAAGAQASSPFFMAPDTPSPSATHPIAQVGVSEAPAAVMNLMQPTPTQSSASGLSSSSTSTALNPLFAPAPQQQQSTFTTTTQHHQQQQLQYANCNASRSSPGISGDDLGAAMAGLNFTIRGSEERMTKQIQKLFHPLVVAQQQLQRQQAQFNMAVIPGMHEQLQQVTTMMSSQAVMLQQQQILLQQQNRLLIQQAQYMQALHRAQVEMKESLDRHMAGSSAPVGAGAIVPPPPPPPIEQPESGPDCLNVASTAMPNEPVIYQAPAPTLAPALVGQSSTPEPKANAYLAVTDNESLTAAAPIVSETPTNQNDKPCTPAASDNWFSEAPEVVVEASGPDTPVSSAAIMPHKLEIATAEVGQSSTPELNHNASTTVTEDDPVTSVAAAPVKLNDKPCATKSSGNDLPETTEVVLAGDLGRHDPISSTTAMLNEREMVTNETTTIVGQSSSPEDKSSTAVSTGDEEPNMAVGAIESEALAHQNEKTCTSASEKESAQPVAVAGDSGQDIPNSSTTTIPFESDIATPETTAIGQSSISELNDIMSATPVSTGDDPNLAVE
jgi:hypothetical protein